MKNKKLLKLLATLALGGVMAVSTFGMAACGGGSSDDKDPDNTEQGGGDVATVTSVTVTAAGNATSVTVGGATLQLTATVTGTNNPAQTVTWSSSDTSKATVSTSGVVTAVSAGTVKITATSTVDTSKKGEITLTVNPAGGGGGGDVDTETSQGYKDFIAAKGNSIVYKNDFETEAEVPYGDATSANGGKVYGSLNNSATDYVDGGYVSISGGKLNIEDTETTYTVFGHIVLDNEITDQVVTVRVEYEIDTAAGGWTQLFIYNSGGDEVIGLRASSSSALGYRIAGVNTVYGSAAMATDTTITAEITLDYVTGSIQVKIDGVDITDSNNNTLAANAKDFKEIRFGTASGARSIYVGNLAVSAEAVDVDALKDYYSAKVAAYSAQLEDVSGVIGNAAKGAKINFDKAIADASDKAAADKAYDDYQVALVTALKSGGVAWVQSIYPADNYTVNENKSDYEAAIAKLTEDLAADGVTTIDKALDIINEAKTTLGGLEDNSYYQKKDITITVKVDSTDAGTISKKVGDKITVAELEAVITGKVPAGNIVTGYHLNDVGGTKLDFGADGYELKEADGTDSGDSVAVTICVEYAAAESLNIGTLAGTHADWVDASNWKLSASAYKSEFTNDGFTLDCAKSGTIKALSSAADTLYGNKSFTHVWLPSGTTNTSNGYTLKANSNVTIVIYWNILNSSLSGQSADLTYVIGEGTPVAAGLTAKTDPTKVYMTQITLSAEDVLTLTTTDGRLSIYAIEYVVHS